MKKTLLSIGVGTEHCTSSSDWMRTDRAHGAAIGDVLTGTLGTGVFEWHVGWGHVPNCLNC